MNNRTIILILNNPAPLKKQLESALSSHTVRAAPRRARDLQSFIDLVTLPEIRETVDVAIIDFRLRNNPAQSAHIRTICMGMFPKALIVSVLDPREKRDVIQKHLGLRKKFVTGYGRHIIVTNDTNPAKAAKAIALAYTTFVTSKKVKMTRS